MLLVYNGWICLLYVIPRLMLASLAFLSVSVFLALDYDLVFVEVSDVEKTSSPVGSGHVESIHITAFVYHIMFMQCFIVCQSISSTSVIDHSRSWSLCKMEWTAKMLIARIVFLLFRLVFRIFVSWLKYLSWCFLLISFLFASLNWRHQGTSTNPWR